MGGGGQGGCERRIEVFVSQDGCERRVEVFVKIQKKKKFFFFGGGGVGGGVRLGVKVDVNEELKFL